MNILNASIAYPDLAEFNKRGKVFALDENKGIIGQLNGDGTIKVYASLIVERDWLETCGISLNEPKEAKAAILKLFNDWDEQLKNYIRHAEDHIVTRRIYMLPVGFKWERKTNVTLIGDAAHVMSPFAGEGVNMAMYDALNLALEIISNGQDFAKAIEIYEESMYAYSSQSAEQSNDILQLCFSDNAAEELANLMNSFHE